MPTAPEFLRRQWMTEESAGDDRAMDYLKKKGYYLTSEWLWIKPSPNHVVTREENSAIAFLVLEWDFGGIVADDYYDAMEAAIDAANEQHRPCPVSEKRLDDLRVWKERMKNAAPQQGTPQVTPQHTPR